MKLNIHRISGLSTLVPTSWLLASCMEFKGKQDLWTQKKPEILQALRERAIIQSVESSNRIDGVEVESQRLKLLVEGTQKPKDRSEVEIVDYKKALSWIYSRKKKEGLTTDIVLHLVEHTHMQSAFYQLLIGKMAPSFSSSTSGK